MDNQDDRKWMGVWDGISRVSVPLFMIVSAYLLVPLREGKSWTDFFKHRAKRILPPMFIFMALYCVLPPLWGAATWTEAWHSLLYMPVLHVSIAIPAITIASYVTSYIVCKLVSLLSGSHWLIG